MQDQIQELAQRAMRILDDNDRIIIAIAGAPGSGKSTLAKEVAKIINRPSQNGYNGSASCAYVVPMDGYHLTRKQLDSLPNSKEAHFRRGAPWTFDAQALVSKVKELRQTDTLGQIIKLPSFDHEIKDPVADAIEIPSNARIILLEGLYLLLDEPPWNEISSLVQDRWFIQVDPQVARKRLAVRHLKAGIVSTLQAGLDRVDFNDSLNGKYILDHCLKPDVTVASVYDPMLAHED